MPWLAALAGTVGSAAGSAAGALGSAASGLGSALGGAAAGAAPAVGTGTVLAPAAAAPVGAGTVLAPAAGGGGLGASLGAGLGVPTAPLAGGGGTGIGNALMGAGSKLQGLGTNLSQAAPNFTSYLNDQMGGHALGKLALGQANPLGNQGGFLGSGFGGGVGQEFGLTLQDAFKSPRRPQQVQNPPMMMPMQQSKGLF